MATQNKFLNTPAHNATAWDTSLNDNFLVLDSIFGGQIGINVTSVASSPVVFPSTVYENMSIAFTGTLGMALTYQVAASVQGQWVVSNGTTGSFSLTIASATGGGTTVTIPQGSVRSIYCDGTNVMYADSQSAASNTQVVYNSGGSLVGSPLMTFNGTSLTANLATSTGLPLGTGVTGTLAVARGGTGVTTSTGSGNVVLSASPTITGTANMSIIQFSDGTALSSSTQNATYHDVTSVRSAGTSYTNSTGRPMMVTVVATENSPNMHLTLIVNGAIVSDFYVGNNISGVKFTVTGMVVPGGTYTISPNGGQVINSWFEYY